MTIYILAEGPSELSFFQVWARRLNIAHEIIVHPHRGKGSLPSAVKKTGSVREGLLDQLPIKLRSFESTLNHHTDSVIVLVDADDDDVDVLVNDILGLAGDLSPSLNIGVCVASEEMEAFYLSDKAALSKAFPNYNQLKLEGYIPDSICGTWELFGEVINDDSKNKVGWASSMGRYCTADAGKTRSPSYRCLLRTIAAFAKLPTTPPRSKKKYRHRAKAAA